MSNKVLITNSQKAVKVPSGLRILIRRACNAVLEFEHFEAPAEISVTFVDNAAIAELNNQYRNKPMPTDVLSFPLGVDGKYDVDENNGCKMLGDIVISMERAQEQATLYGKMNMAEKLAFLDEQYLSRMPKSASRPRLTVQDEQVGAKRNIPYYTEKPEPDEAQCALAWYTGAFSDRERQLGVEILLDALLGTNQAPLKAALLEEKLGADIDVGFDDSTLQPTLELVLRGATEESAGKFAAAVRKAVDGILEKGIRKALEAV